MSLFESKLRRWGRIVWGLPTLGIYVKIDVYLEFLKICSLIPNHKRRSQWAP